MAESRGNEQEKDREAIGSQNEIRGHRGDPEATPGQLPVPDPNALGGTGRGNDPEKS
jgi:hypothetical protein